MLRRVGGGEVVTEKASSWELLSRDSSSQLRERIAKLEGLLRRVLDLKKACIPAGGGDCWCASCKLTREIEEALK